MIALAPVSCPVDCAGGRHHLVWRDGQLTAVDHPDADRERALTALGGETYRCLQLVTAWEQHADDLDVLLLAARGPQDRIAVGHHHHRHGGRRSGWQAYAPLSSAPGPIDDGSGSADLRDVLRLGGGVPDRLAAQVIDTWARRLDAGDAAVEAARPRLHAALYGRFAATVRSWLGDPGVRVDLTTAGPGTDPVIERSDDGLQVELPFSWLVDVWLPGLALVADMLCVAARQPEPDRFELTVLDRRLTHRTSATIELRRPQ